MTAEVSEKAELATRPASVVWYERLALAAFAATLASAAANRATLAKYYGQDPVFYPIAIACVLALQLLWIWLISRKRKNWARWISLVMLAFAIPLEILHFDERIRLGAAAAISYYAATGLWMIAVSLLLRPDARRWFAVRPSAADSGSHP